MLRVLFTKLDEFYDELLVLRNKRLARNLKEAMIIRGGLKEEKAGERESVAYLLIQVMADFDGEKMLFEWISPRTPLYENGQGEEHLAGLRKQHTELLPRLNEEGLVRPGIFIA